MKESISNGLSQEERATLQETVNSIVEKHKGDKEETDSFT